MYKFLLMAMLLAAPQAYAQSDELPVDIQADSLELEQEKGYAVFAGKVQAKHGDIELGADKLEVYYAQKSSKKEDVGGSISKIIADGSVTILYENDTATGDRAVYEPKSGDITMTGKVVMVREGNVLKGERLIYNAKTKKMRLVSGDSRVKASFSVSASKK